MQECVSTLRTSRTRIQQGAAQLIRIYQDEMVASKESDRLVEESLEALFEQGIGSAGLSAGNAGDDGGASRAELEKAETEIALLRSQLDAAHDGHNADLEEAEGVNQHLTEMLMKHNGDMAESSDDSGGETPPIDIGGKTPPIDIKLKKVRALCKKHGIRATGE